MKIYKVVTGAFLAIILGGCATPLPSIHNVDPNNLDENQALLIVSAGAAETCTSFSSAFVVKDVNQPPTMSKSIGVFQLNNSFVKSDFEDEYGKVYTTVMEPGEYDFWLYAQNPFFSFKDSSLSTSFTLKPKEILYVGEIYADGCTSLNLSISDKSERDLNLIKSVKPALEIQNVVVSPIEIVFKNE